MNGTIVNENVRYEDKREVYLDGGPGPNAPQHAAGLPDGNYYFQVTDPSGKVLLSSDSIRCREVRVENGVIAQYVAALSGLNLEKVHGVWTLAPCQGALVNNAYGLYEFHNTGIDFDHGAVTIQLFPFDDTPNPGGVYKVWLTPVADYAGSYPDDCLGEKGACNVRGENWQPGNAHGFLPARSKTDNFKVKYKGKPFLAPEIRVKKFHDANLNGFQDAGEENLPGWTVYFRDPADNENTLYTPEVVVAGEAGAYVFTESNRPGTMQTVAMLDGVPQSVYPTANPMVVVDVAYVSGEIHAVVYGNVGLGSITACKHYDQNGDGAISGPLEVGIAGWRFRLDPGGLVQTTGADGCTVFADLLPGQYLVTELFPTGSTWTSSDGITWSQHTIESTITESVLAGTAASADFANTCTEGGIGFGTKGYWHNKNGLTELQNDDIDYANALAPYATPSSYFDDCDEPFDGVCSSGLVPAPNGAIGDVAPEGSARAEVSRFLVDANAGGDPREQLAQQLLAFIFNARNRLGSPDDVILLPGSGLASANELIDEAVDAWLSMDPVWIQDIKNLLTSLNESGCDVVYDPLGFETDQTDGNCITVIPVEPCEVVYPE